MLIFGVEISLVEVITGFAIITTIILLEVLGVMILALYQLQNAKKINQELVALLSSLIEKKKP